MKSWKTVPLSKFGPDRIELQWSHDGEVVEDSVIINGVELTYELQWSHDGEVVEDVHPDCQHTIDAFTSMEPRR